MTQGQDFDRVALAYERYRAYCDRERAALEKSLATGPEALRLREAMRQALDAGVTRSALRVAVKSYGNGPRFNALLGEEK